MGTGLFHFSDDGSIDYFEPRSVRVPSRRDTGSEWLNCPLVRAIDDWRQPMYLFPRDCPRILLWLIAKTSADDKELYFKNSDARIVAYVEKSWMSKLQSETLCRYEMPANSFNSLDDAGMWVSKTGVIPIKENHIENLPTKLQDERVELRALDVLTPLRDAWNSSLHVSGIRLRNAKNWAS